jgi:hypothetical protein
MKIRVAIVGLALLGLSGCTVITPEERASAPIDPLPKDYQAQIKDFEMGRLKDPYTAVYRFGSPQRGYWQDGLVYGGAKHFGTSCLPESMRKTATAVMSARRPTISPLRVAPWPAM